MNTIKTSTLRERTYLRLQQSIAGEPSDGHAVFHGYSFPFYQNCTGVDLQKYFHEPKVMFDTQLEVLELMDRCGNFAPDPGPVAECNGMGGRVEFDEHGFIVAGKPIEIDPEDPGDYEKIKPGDPYGNNYMRITLENLEYMVQHAPKGIEVNAPSFMGAFTICCLLCGITNFCINTLLEPDFVSYMLDTAVQTSINYIEAVQKVLGHPLHHMYVCDDLSAMISADAYEEWVVPTYKKLSEVFPQTQFWLHNDAKAGHLMEKIGETRFIKAWQYAPMLKSEEVLERTGGGVSLFGGLNPVEMQQYSAQQTYDICIEKLKSFGGNNKYVLGVGGTVNQIPVENLLAMLKAADDFKI